MIRHYVCSAAAFLTFVLWRKLPVCFLEAVLRVLIWLAGWVGGYLTFGIFIRVGSDCALRVIGRGQFALKMEFPFCGNQS